MLPKDRMRTNPKIPERLPNVGHSQTKVEHLEEVTAIPIPEKIDLRYYRGILSSAPVRR